MTKSINIIDTGIKIQTFVKPQRNFFKKEKGHTKEIPSSIIYTNINVG